eukprot:SAG31_NODE_1468_length_8223_cov_37.850320_2_plen_145_part_00
MLESYVVAQYQLFTLLTSICLFACGASLLVGTIELFIREVYTYNAALQWLGTLLLIAAVINILLTVFAICTSFIPKESGARARRFKIYLLLAFLLTPCAGAMSLLCFTLSPNPFINLPQLTVRAMRSQPHFQSGICSTLMRFLL